MTTWTRKQQFEQVHRYGGCVVQAHPFRAAWYIHAIHLSTHLVDAVEGYNAGNQRAWNVSGMHYAHLTGLPVTAGSDNHHADQMNRSNLAGVYLDRPFTSLQDYIDLILNRKPIALHLPETLPPWTEEIEPELPVFVLDAEEQKHPVSATDVLRNRRFL
ncbi:MAG: hypothetical protein IJ088_16945 [Clostridia bacterium]|nr:hypothetical protein [Clostridia bacterium]